MPARTHGMSTSPEFLCWQGIIKRCENPKATYYKYYGGRGISICKEWRESFAAFFAYVGPRPSKLHSIERERSNGNYEPGNVHWATAVEQSRNRPSFVRLITANGITMLLTDWSRKSGLSRACIKHRLAKGMSPEEAVSLPAMSILEAAKLATFVKTGVRL
jgi:hypothetical protein